MKWQKLKSSEYYYYRESYYSGNLIEISNLLFKPNTWRIKFDDLWVGELESDSVNEVKKLALKEYKIWKKRREDSGLHKIFCEHDEIDLMLYYGSLALSKIKIIMSRENPLSSIDRHLKQDLNYSRLKQLDESFYQFRQDLKKIYDQWGLEENDPVRSELLYRDFIFRIE